MLAREGAEPVAGAFVRRDRLVAGVLRVSGDLLCDGSHLLLDRGTVLRLVQQCVNPVLGTVRTGAVPTRDVVVEEQLPEQDPGADVGERLEREDAVRRLDAGGEDGVVAKDALDDLPDRLVDERDPDVVQFSHARIMPSSPRSYP